MSRFLRDLIGEVNTDLEQQICDGLNCLDGVLWFLPSGPSTPFGLPDRMPGLGTEDRRVWGLPWRAARVWCRGRLARVAVVGEGHWGVRAGSLCWGSLHV